MSNPHQRTEEWFKSREGKLTASSFGAAAGLGPTSRQALWRRTKGLETFDGNDATRWGEEHEPVALAFYEGLENTKLDLAGFVVHPEIAWLGGSPDALLPAENLLIEIKCPFSGKTYPEIPPYYMAQCQGLMQITKTDKCDFVCWTPEQTSIWRFDRSDEYWVDFLYPALAEFWGYVAADVEPPRLPRPKAPDIESVRADVLNLGE